MTDERGCGVREPGGIYFVTPIRECLPNDPRCAPVEKFLYDPPLDTAHLAIPNRGVLILERPDGSGIHDVWDRVGMDGYPNPADMIEEIRRMGVSRRASKSIDFSQLGPGSLIILVHPRAIVTNAADLYAELAKQQDETPDKVVPFHCPTDHPNHVNLPYSPVPEAEQETCAGVWWETLTKADPIYDLSAARRSCTRTVGSTTYKGRVAPYDVELDYADGAFARFPIKRLEVVADPDGEESDKAMERLENARLPVVEVDD